MLLKGAKADKLVRDGISALHLIAGKDSQENFKVLEYCTQNTRSNTNIKSSEGLTPVHVAALWGRVQNLKLLTSRGGNIHELDDEGNNVLDFASLSSENDATDCIKFLLEFENSKTHAEPQKEGQEPYYDSEFTESFYTAIGEANDSILDHSTVTFPKLHPWNVKISSTDYDATLIDGLSNLSVASDRYICSLLIHNVFLENVPPPPHYSTLPKIPIQLHTLLQKVLPLPTSLPAGISIDLP